MNDEDEFENDDIATDLEEDAPYTLVSSDDGVDVENVGGYRASLRQQIQSDVEAFLASGGRITEVPANVVSDPPKKPQSNYGGQPI